jgi:hypothetical protein
MHSQYNNNIKKREKIQWKVSPIGQIRQNKAYQGLETN